MTADILPIRRGRPSTATLLERVQRLRLQNDVLRAENYALTDERDRDAVYLAPLASRFVMVAREFGPETLSTALALSARIERMGRRGKAA